MITRMLEYDANDPRWGDTSSSVSGESGDLLQVPTDHSAITVDFGVVATACTVAIAVQSGATFNAITEDIEGTTYPRASFTGAEQRSFRISPGSTVRINGTSVTYSVVSYRDKVVRATSDVPGLDVALGDKADAADYLALAGGALTGAVTTAQANGVTTPRIAITQSHATLLYGQAAFSLVNAATGIGMQIDNAAAGWGLAIRNQSTGEGIDVLNASTGKGIAIANTGGSFGMYVTNSGAGYGAYFLTNTGATGPAFRAAVNTASSSGAHAMQLTDKGDGTSNAMCGQIDHFGIGYGINISNKVGASAAMVIHQYSQKADHAALWIDNCGTQPAIRCWNTENATLAPGQLGTGDFLSFMRRPATGEALVDAYRITGEGCPVLIPKAAAPSVLADGMLWVEGAGAAMALKVRLNGATKTVTAI